MIFGFVFVVTGNFWREEWDEIGVGKEKNIRFSILSVIFYSSINHISFLSYYRIQDIKKQKRSKNILVFTDFLHK